MNYAIAAFLIQAIIEGIKKIRPFSGWVIKAAAFGLAAAFVAVYPSLNVLAEVNLQSAYPVFDQAFSIIALGLFAMVGYDILQVVKNR